MCAATVEVDEKAIREGKNKALKMALDKIEKDFGKGSIMRLGDKTSVDCECIPTGALALDIALGIGGVPRGRIIEIYGPESSGKTTLAQYDDRGNIGKRYRRQDEIGTPYCVTYDFESETDGCVTVRERDSMQQERVKIEDLKGYFAQKFRY